MSDTHQTLFDLLALEPLEVDLFRGTGHGGETSTRIFGGQVIGQALAAAYGTVPDLHCTPTLFALVTLKSQLSIKWTAPVMAAVSRQGVWSRSNTASRS